MKLKYFYKTDHNKQPIPGSNIRRKSSPGKQWKEILTPCCNGVASIPTTSGPRFFVQLDHNNRPIDGSLIKRNGIPEMVREIKYLELEWRKACCIVPEFLLIAGFGLADAGDPCTGGSEEFYADSQIEVGTKLYQSDKLTPVTFSQFRDDETGIIYTVQDGVVTGIAGGTCSQLVQVTNSTLVSDNYHVTAVTFNDLALVSTGAGDFPILADQAVVFNTANSSVGNKTVKVTVTGGTAVGVTDSNGVYVEQVITGPGTYTFENIYTSAPNELTSGVGIGLY